MRKSKRRKPQRSNRRTIRRTTRRKPRAPRFKLKVKVTTAAQIRERQEKKERAFKAKLFKLGRKRKRIPKKPQVRIQRGLPNSKTRRVIRGYSIHVLAVLSASYKGIGGRETNLVFRRYFKDKGGRRVSRTVASSRRIVRGVVDNLRRRYKGRLHIVRFSVSWVGRKGFLRSKK